MKVHCTSFSLIHCIYMYPWNAKTRSNETVKHLWSVWEVINTKAHSLQLLCIRHECEAVSRVAIETSLEKWHSRSKAQSECKLIYCHK